MAYTMKIQMRRLLYRLKREYGELAHLYRVTSNVNDVRTGKIDVEYEVYKIRRTIMLPKRLTQKFSYDLTFLAANKNFQYGALYGLGMREIIIDMRDIPDNVTPDNTWHIIYDHKRFELKDINFYDYRLAMYIVAHETTNQLPFEWHNENVNSQIDFFEAASGTKS